MRRIFITASTVAILSSSCEKKQIDFGESLVSSATKLILIDTLTPLLSTVVIDSFQTAASNIALFGRTKDVYAGEVTADAYFQFGLPTVNSITANMIPSDAIFDSLVLKVHLSANYYGDTAVQQTYTLHALTEQPQFEYANQLYNTSYTPYEPSPVSTVTRILRPNASDSLLFRFDVSKGTELFNHVKNYTDQVVTEDAFMSYLKGFKLGVSDNDHSGIYASDGLDSTLSLELHYHHTIPDHEAKVISFPIGRNAYQYNRIINNKTGTLFESTQNAGHGVSVVVSNETYPFGISQSGIGYLLKINFPTIRELLKIHPDIVIIDASLQIEPVFDSYEKSKFILPANFFLVTTDATNSIGSPLQTGDDYLLFNLNADYMDKFQTNYSVNITNYIQALLKLSNAADQGLFIMQNSTGFSTNLNRAVIASSLNKNHQVKLTINALVVH
jgi:hypothetical protein